MGRAEAKALGLKTYNTGRLCKYGHYPEREVNDKACVVCKRGRNKEHRSNPDRVTNTTTLMYEAKYPPKTEDPLEEFY